MKDDIPPRLGDLLDTSTRGAGIEDAAGTGTVWNKWSAIVGPDIALHAEPSSLRGGVLRVRADSPAWATELGYLGEEIRRRANEVVGTDLVAEVRVWTGPGRIRSAPPARKTPPLAVVKAHDRDVDPVKAFQRAFQAWRNRRRGAPGDRGGPS